MDIYRFKITTIFFLLCLQLLTKATDKTSLSHDHIETFKKQMGNGEDVKMEHNRGEGGGSCGRVQRGP